MAALDPPQPEPERAPSVVRREPVRVEGAATYFVPGVELGAATCEASPAILDSRYAAYDVSDPDVFGVLAFSLPMKAAVGAVVARVTKARTSFHGVAIYSGAGDKLLQAAEASNLDRGRPFNLR